MPVKDGVVPNTERIAYVAERVRERRERLGLDQDLKAVTAVEGAPSRQTVGALETRGVWPKTTKKQLAWSKALRWEGNALTALAEGREPVEMPEPPSAIDSSAVADQMEEAAHLIGRGVEAILRAAQQLREGQRSRAEEQRRPE